MAEQNPELMEWHGDENNSCSPSKDILQRGHKVACRYGRGCTHISDLNHQNMFWHPRPVELSQYEDFKNGNFCHECGDVFDSLSRLQLHLRRKTAWSNLGLVGCRVSCFVDNCDWKEGRVLEFLRSGKHCVELVHTKEKLILRMLQTTFYIIERPLRELCSKDAEVKESEDIDNEMLAPIEDWNYSEDISLDYAAAQSLMFKSYGGRVLETGHKTVGHLCVTETDKAIAKQQKGCLLYGELLPRGVNKALGITYLNAASASVVYDLGMGLGKVAMQVFLQFPNLNRVYGIELCVARYTLAVKAMKELVSICSSKYFIFSEVEGKSIQLKSLSEERFLEFECGNFFDIKGIETVDIVLFETDVPQDSYVLLSNLMHRMKEGSRTLTYLDLKKTWACPPFPLRQLSINTSLSDRYPTSWSVHRGHHFFLWCKISPSYTFGDYNQTCLSGVPKRNSFVRRLSRFFKCFRSSKASTTISAHGSNNLPADNVIKVGSSPISGAENVSAESKNPRRIQLAQESSTEGASNLLSPLGYQQNDKLSLDSNVTS